MKLAISYGRHSGLSDHDVVPARVPGRNEEFLAKRYQYSSMPGTGLDAVDFAGRRFVKKNTERTMRTSLWVATAALLAALAGWNDFEDVPEEARSAVEAVSADRIESHVRFLADDRLGGRKPATPGFDEAVDYLVAEMKATGLEPSGTDGTWTQSVPLRTSTLVAQATSVRVRNGEWERELAIGEDVAITANMHYEDVEMTAPVAFVGYGISAPELGLDDYADIDVEGKIVLMFYEGPTSLPPTVRAHHSRRSTKYEVARRKGAAGVILTTMSSRTPFSRYRAWLARPRTGLVGEEGEPQLKLTAIMDPDSLHKLIPEAVYDPDSLAADFVAGEVGSFDLGVDLVVKYRSIHSDFSSPNVVGMLRGDDPVLSGEYVVHSAHLDHVGIGQPVKGDSVYNGAHDNAAGVAGVLEGARAFKALPEPPARSQLFLFVTAEESGLLGSEYFANNPTVPRESIVANVNQDMPLMIAPLKRIIAHGAQHSSLHNETARAAAMLGIEIVEDDRPEEMFFVRSDQYSFVKVGIPAVSFDFGLKSDDPKDDFSEVHTAFLREFYHKPTDDISAPFDFDAGRKYVQLNFLVSYLVSENADRPRWNEGDVFEPSAE
jgi:hypothetical protein